MTVASLVFELILRVHFASLLSARVLSLTPLRAWSRVRPRTRIAYGREVFILLLTHGLGVLPQVRFAWGYWCSGFPLCTESGATRALIAWEALFGAKRGSILCYFIMPAYCALQMAAHEICLPSKRGPGFA
jgi:hypothetical protein